MVMLITLINYPCRRNGCSHKVRELNVPDDRALLETADHIPMVFKGIFP